MNSLPYWLSSSLLFLEGFSVASVIAGATYWMWRSRWVYAQIIAYIFEFFVVLASVGIFALAFIVETVFALGALGLFLAFSVGQGFFERAIDFQMRPVRHHRTRSFISYLCATALGLLLASGLSQIPGKPFKGAFLFYEVVGASAPLSGYGIGYGVGFFFAPLLISYFRYLLPNFRLSRGGERPLVLEAGDALQDDEIVKYST